jgi:aryl-alcohol dehydrogenase-like predicted oxidoreductase
MKAISKLILGTVQFGLNYGINNLNGKPEKENVFEILSHAYKNGIRYLDTAELYGNAHELIGEFHKLNPKKIFKVITKFPHEFDGNMEMKINRYLEQLHIVNLHAILFHSFESYIKHKSQLNKKINNVDKIGVSVYTNEQMNKVIEDSNIDIIQLPFNLFDNLNLRGDILIKAKEKNKIIHSRSAFLQGLFFMNKDNPSPIRIKLENELDLIEKVSLESSLPIGAIALNYCLMQKNINGVLIGVDSLEQLKQNISFATNKIPNQHLNEIKKIKINNIELLNPATWK